MDAQGPRAATERIPVALWASGVLRVRGRLNRVELHDPVGVLDLQVHAATRLDSAADDPRDFFKPRPDVPLDGRSLLVREHAIRPLLDGVSPARRVDHRVPLRKVTSVELLEVRLHRLRSEAAKRLDAAVAELVRDPERRSHRQDYRPPWDRGEQLVDEIRLLLASHAHILRSYPQACNSRARPRRTPRRREKPSGAAQSAPLRCLAAR